MGFLFLVLHPLLSSFLPPFSFNKKSSTQEIIHTYHPHPFSHHSPSTHFTHHSISHTLTQYTHSHHSHYPTHFILIIQFLIHSLNTHTHITLTIKFLTRSLNTHTHITLTHITYLLPQTLTQYTHSNHSHSHHMLPHTLTSLTSSHTPSLSPLSLNSLHSSLNSSHITDYNTSQYKLHQPFANSNENAL